MIVHMSIIMFPLLSAIRYIFVIIIMILVSIITVIAFTFTGHCYTITASPTTVLFHTAVFQNGRLFDGVLVNGRLESPWESSRFHRSSTTPALAMPMRSNVLL